jgi:hypothetical protein
VQRRTVLKRGLVTAALAVSLAGCSGSDSDGDDGGDDSNGTETGEDSDGPSATGESGLNRSIEVFPESVTENVEVVAVEEVEATDTRLEVDVTLKNTSDQDVRMDNYAITLTAFTTEEPTGDASDRIQAATSIEYQTNEQEPTPPDETVTLGYSLTVPSDTDATIGSYTVSVACGGVYDPPGCG